MVPTRVSVSRPGTRCGGSGARSVALALGHADQLAELGLCHYSASMMGAEQTTVVTLECDPAPERMRQGVAR
jgi:hypothetical protein